jgi:hypothetical protein
MSYNYNPAVTILPWPEDVEPSERVLHRTGKTSVLVSPLTRATQTQELVGGTWVLSLKFPPLDEEQQRSLRVFFARLKGMSGYFYVAAESTVAMIPEQPDDQGPDLVSDEPRLSVQLTPGQLETEGWDEPAGTLLFSAGEYVSYDDANGWRRLHVVVRDCYAQDGGLATLEVQPPVRASVTPGARLHIACPNGIFRLPSDDEGVITQTAESGEVSISAVEAFPPRVMVD